MTTFRYRQDTKPGTFKAMFQELGSLLKNFQRTALNETEGVYRMPNSAIGLTELTTDAVAPATDEVVIYARVTGGKTELVARFPTGAIQQIAIEP